jgi:CDP-diacylglycerol---serine O-phosphatidyltransferase
MGNTVVKDIPNLITLGNLACGVLALLAIQSGELIQASWFILIAAGLDFLDGFAARLLKADSALGLQLDSLADLVTFGVAPGFIMHALMNHFGYCSADGFCINNYVFILIPLFSAYRLAKFNVDTRQKSGFIGVPTPAMGLLIASFPFITASEVWEASIITDFYFLKFFPLVGGYLLISELPLMAFKPNTFALRENIFRYLFLIILLGGIIAKGWHAVPYIFVSYLILSVAHHFLNKAKTGKEDTNALSQ